MQEVIDFTTVTLKEWSHRFEGIRLRYAYDSESDFHIIEVSPESVRRGNKEYERAEAEFWMSFLERFPHCDLLISEPCSSNNMTNVIFDNSVTIQTEKQQIEVLMSNFYEPMACDETIQNESNCEEMVYQSVSEYNFRFSNFESQERKKYNHCPLAA